MARSGVYSEFHNTVDTALGILGVIVYLNLNIYALTCALLNMEAF